MKYKINYKSLDAVDHKELVKNKIKEFYKNKYSLAQKDFDKENWTRFDWKHQIPGMGAPAKDVILVIDWDEYEIFISEDGTYIPFTNKELEFFDKLGFELYDDFSKVMKQDITDWITNNEI
jgi:hypothetical protein